MLLKTQEDTELSLYKKKLGLIQNMRRLTEESVIGGADGAEKYIALVGQREKMMIELKVLDQKLQDPEMAVFDFTGEIAQTKMQIAQAAREVVALEEKLTQSLPVIMNELKDSLKRVKDGQHLSQAYRAGVTVAFGARYDLRQ